MKRKELRITDKIIHEEKSPINKKITNDNYNIETRKLTNESSIISSKKDLKLNWIKWKNNSCRYDKFITLYITIYENYIKNTLSNCNILINYLHKCSLNIIYDINIKFW